MPLLTEMRRIRDKDDLSVFKIFTSHFNDREPWGDITVTGDPEEKKHEVLYSLSYCGEDKRGDRFLEIKWNDLDDAPDDMEEEVE